MLGYQEVGDDDLLDPHRRGPSFWFQQMDAPRPQRNRIHIHIHIDVYLPHDQVEARIAAALAAGGHLVSDANAPEWWTLATPRATRSTWPSADRSRRLTAEWAVSHAK